MASAVRLLANFPFLNKKTIANQGCRITAKLRMLHNLCCKGYAGRHLDGKFVQDT